MNIKKSLKKNKIFLIGDFFLDEYIYCKCNRLSPEKPVPVLNVTKSTQNLGGAGNVLNNLLNIGAYVTVLGAVGNDHKGKIIQNKIKGLKKKYSLDNLIQFQKNIKTISKKRVILNGDQLMRIDHEYVKNFNKVSIKLKTKIKDAIKKSSLIIISDYGKGFCTKQICKLIIDNAKKQNIKVIVDPRKYINDYEKYVNADFITPNLNELRLLFPNIKNNDKEIFKSSRKIIQKFKINNVLVTRSEKGLTLTNILKNINVRTHSKNVLDVSGAGDTCISVFSILFILFRQNVFNNLDIVNQACSKVISKNGTVPITRKEFMAVIKKFRF